MDTGEVRGGYASVNRSQVMSEVMKIAAELQGEFGESFLDDFIIELKLAEASSINNLGLDGQIKFVMSVVDEKSLIDILTEIREELRGEAPS